MHWTKSVSLNHSIIHSEVYTTGQATKDVVITAGQARGQRDKDTFLDPDNKICPAIM